MAQNVIAGAADTSYKKVIGWTSALTLAFHAIHRAVWINTQLLGAI